MLQHYNMRLMGIRKQRSLAARTCHPKTALPLQKVKKTLNFLTEVVFFIFLTLLTWTPPHGFFFPSLFPHHWFFSSSIFFKKILPSSSDDAALNDITWLNMLTKEKKRGSWCMAVEAAECLRCVEVCVYEPEKGIRKKRKREKFREGGWERKAGKKKQIG